MKILDRYIGTRYVWGFVLVLLILVSLFSFLEFVAQLDDIGKGRYELQDAFLFVALTLPRRILDMVPISTLLGSIISLGLLAESGELVAMHAAGLSVKRICWSVLLTTGILMLGVGMLAEFVAPSMEQYARTKRSLALSNTGILMTRQGFWTRHGLSFIRVGRTFSGGIAADLDIYEWDQQGRLRSFIHAREADIRNDKRWLLKGIEQKTIADYAITTKRLPTLTLNSFLSPEQVTLLELPPDSLSPSDLYQYIQTLRERRQNPDHYAMALWQKVSIPLATGAMIVLSLPFVFGPPRETTVGRRIMMGTMAGIAFYMGNRIITYLGLLIDLHPALIALGPVLAILCLGFWLLRRAS